MKIGIMQPGPSFEQAHGRKGITAGKKRARSRDMAVKYNTASAITRRTADLNTGGPCDSLNSVIKSVMYRGDEIDCEVDSPGAARRSS